MICLIFLFLVFQATNNICSDNNEVNGVVCSGELTEELWRLTQVVSDKPTVSDTKLASKEEIKARELNLTNTVFRNYKKN